MSRLKTLRKKLANFSPRGSNCPICGRNFRDEDACPHSVGQAREHLVEQIQREIVRQELKR